MRTAEETLGGAEEAARAEMPLRVAVLVPLTLAPGAGGHVTCWKKLAAAAVDIPDFLDLTVYFLGARDETQTVASNVRYRTLRPLLTTARIPFLAYVPDHTDLAPFHPRLARLLNDYDVVHTTDGHYAFAKTAAYMARRGRVVLTNSIHTDIPSYSRLFTARTLERLFGPRLVALLARRGVDFPALAEHRARAALLAQQVLCDRVLVSREDEYDRARAVQPASRVSWLRRGIDFEAFHPRNRDRDRLVADHGLPTGSLLVCYVGRLDRSKNVCDLAVGIRAARAAGYDVHLFCAGLGEDRAALEDLLGSAVTFAGHLPPDEVARVLASADVCAMPSRYEVLSNAVMEAMASGVPVAVDATGGMERFVEDGVSGFLVPRDGWGEAIMAWASMPPDRLRAIGLGAREAAVRTLPTWRDVLSQDLLPVWRAAVERQKKRP